MWRWRGNIVHFLMCWLKACGFLALFIAATAIIMLCIAGLEQLHNGIEKLWGPRAARAFTYLGAFLLFSLITAIAMCR